MSTFVEELPLLTIVGAPKCGTTAIAEALAAHPDVLFSSPKEPYFFGSDLRPLRAREGIHSTDEYRRTFVRGDASKARLRAEATTLYLSSPDALTQLREAYPNTRIVCCVRNPVDIAVAFHMQLVYAEFEPLTDFAVAWSAQEQRRHRPPVGCPVPRLVQYAEIASVGSHLQRAFGIFPREQIHVVVHDDLKADPATEMIRLASFLGIDSIHLSLPDAMNSAMQLRSPRLARIIRSTPGRQVARWAHRALPGAVARPLFVVKSARLRRSSERPPLLAALAAEVAAALENEVVILERLLDRRLDAWRANA